MNCSLARSRTTAGAIRLLDVAAIVCVVSVLGFLVLLAGHRMRGHSLVARCRGNLLQVAKALDFYSKANNDLLPDCSRMNPRYGGAVWPWDISTNLTHDLEAYGMTRAAFYCPANPDMNDDKHWNFHNGPFRVVNYLTLYKGVATIPPSLQREKLASPGAAHEELSFDATAALNDDFARVQGVYTDRSNHMRDSQPLGGNILFLDGHVAWRDFASMQVRIQSRGGAGRIDWSF